MIEWVCTAVDKDLNRHRTQILILGFWTSETYNKNQAEGNQQNTPPGQCNGRAAEYLYKTCSPCPVINTHDIKEKWQHSNQRKRIRDQTGQKKKKKTKAKWEKRTPR